MTGHPDEGLAAFGEAGSVRVARLVHLPRAMQREGLLLMLEMGADREQLIGFAASRGLGDARAILRGVDCRPMRHATDSLAHHAGASNAS